MPTAPSPTVTHFINVVAAVVVVVDTDAAATQADIDLRYENSTLWVLASLSFSFCASGFKCRKETECWEEKLRD